MADMKVIKPRRFTPWEFAMRNMAETLAAVNLLDKRVYLPNAKPQFAVDDTPLASTTITAENLEIALQILDEHNELFAGQLHKKLTKLHAEITEHNDPVNLELCCEEPRSYSELNDVIRDAWETLKSEMATEFQFQVPENLEQPFYEGLNEEKLFEIDEYSVYRIARGFKAILNELTFTVPFIGIVDSHGVMTSPSTIDSVILNERWLNYLQNCELKFVTYEVANQKSAINPAFQRMGSSSDIMRFLFQLSCETLHDSESFIIELWNFYSLVICGSYSQMLKCVNISPFDSMEDIDELANTLALVDSDLD